MSNGRKFKPENEFREYKDYYLTFKNDNRVNHKKVSSLLQYFGRKGISKLPKELRKEICAFLNNNIQNGLNTSYIILGVDDITRQMSKAYKIMCGIVSREFLFEYVQMTLAGWLKSDFIPSASPYVHIMLKNVGNNKLIYIKVTSPSNICFWTKYKKDWHVFIRIGSSSVVSTPNNLYRIIRETILRDYKMKPLIYDQKNFTQRVPKFKYLRMRSNKKHLNFNKIVHILKNNSEYYCKSALLFSDNNILKVKLFISYKNKLRILIIKGSIVQQIDNIMYIINIYYKGKCLLNIIKEIVINAYAHRTYYTYEKNCINIFIYKNHILVSSPGIYPGNLSTQMICDGVTFLRNPIIYRVLIMLEYSKKTDIHGIPMIEKIFSSSKTKVSPVFYVDYKRDRVNVLLPIIRNNTQHKYTITFSKLLKRNMYKLNNLKNYVYIVDNKKMELLKKSILEKSKLMQKMCTVRNTVIKNIKKNKKFYKNNYHENLRISTKIYCAQIFEYFKYHSRINRRIVASICNVVPTTASNTLSKLTKKNKIILHRKGRDSFYTKP